MTIYDNGSENQTTWEWLLDLAKKGVTNKVSGALSGAIGVAKGMNGLDWSKLGSKGVIGYTPGVSEGKGIPYGISDFSLKPSAGDVRFGGEGNIPKPGTIDWFNGVDLSQVGGTNAGPNWSDDPYLKALYASLGGGADTSGYDRALKQTSDERKRMQQRYNTYSAQISDVFGNLSRKTLPEMLTATAQSSEAIRGQQAAQQAQYAQETRSAEQARLNAANAARQGLGLEGSAEAGATGDLVTQTTEAGLADKAGMDAATLQTILTNEATAKGDINRQISGLGIAQDQAMSTLNMSREDALAALAAQQAQIETQRSQAITAAQPSTAERLAVIQAAEDYKNSKLSANGNGSTDPASQWIAANPNFQQPAQELLASFLPWFYNSAPAVEQQTGKTPTFDQYLQSYAKADPAGAALLSSNPPLRDFLKAYLSTK
jgi:hypothetical protein